MTRRSKKVIHEGRYAAEVFIVLEYRDASWSPAMSVADAQKLETVRLALRRNDVAEATRHGRVFEVVPISV